MALEERETLDVYNFFFVQPGELFCALLHDICVCVCVFGANIDNNLELENIFNFVYTGIFAAQAVGP